MSKRELNRIDVLARLDGHRLTASAVADLMRVTVRQTAEGIAMNQSHSSVVATSAFEKFRRPRLDPHQ